MREEERRRMRHNQGESWVESIFFFKRKMDSCRVSVVIAKKNLETPRKVHRFFKFNFFSLSFFGQPWSCVFALRGISPQTCDLPGICSCRHRGLLRWWQCLANVHRGNWRRPHWDCGLRGTTSTDPCLECRTEGRNPSTLGLNMDGLHKSTRGERE